MMRYGLVVCGGFSSRMGQDKSLLVYHDQPQRYHVYHLLQQLCDKVFLSCNHRQLTEIAPGYLTLPDEQPYHNIGPMAALLTAWNRYPEAELLVLGCDYPFLTLDDIRLLCRPTTQTTATCAAQNPATGITEPLIAFYRQDIRPLLYDHYRQGRYALRRVLEQHTTHLVTGIPPGHLESVDTPDRYEQARALLQRRG